MESSALMLSNSIHVMERLERRCPVNSAIDPRATRHTDPIPLTLSDGRFNASLTMSLRWKKSELSPVIGNSLHANMW